MNNFKQVSAMLAQRAEEIAFYLLPHGKKIGNEWCAGSIYGEAGKSLKVCLTGDKAGVWCDFASGTDKGDLIDLWAATRKVDLRTALLEAENYLGLEVPKFEIYQTKSFTKPSMAKITPIIPSSPVMDYLLNERLLSAETIAAFKIGESRRNIIFPYIRNNELIFIKQISLDRLDNGKKQIFVESGCEPCLFGWDLINPSAREITICEGEIDCMTLYQYGQSALSVPLGGGKGDKQKWIQYEYDRLAVFNVIYLCFDNDKTGDEAVEEIIKRLGRHRCKVVKLPFNDTNECLQNGVTKEEIESCFKAARTLDPGELKSASLYIQEVIEEFYPSEGVHKGYNTPWSSAHGKILFRPSELSIFSGLNGHGKSQFIGHIILQAMKEGARVCAASLEIKPKKFLMRLTRQAAACNEPEENYIRAIHEWYEDKLWLFNVTGTTKTDRLLEVFLYARERYGVDVFVIDSLMKCGIDEEDFKAQKIFIDKLCDFKNEHDCHIFLIAHPRKQHDEISVPGKLDIKGSGTITDLADNCFIVWRNKLKEELMHMQQHGASLTMEQLKKLEEVDAVLRCDKNRNGDYEGKIGLWFDTKSYQYLSSSKHRPKHFVEYSRITANHQH